MAEASIRHVIPQIGRVTLPLYEPADDLYRILTRNREIRRLSSLRHLGALSIALDGARLARWDYTAALLYYSKAFGLSGFKSSFRIGRIYFSSTTAALQCMSLIWNIGHLPGTYATEKGIYRYLNSHNSRRPASMLNWPFENNAELSSLRRKANTFLIERDYAALCRVLAVIKLLDYCDTDDSWLFQFVTDFAAPMLLQFDGPFSKQWPKLRGTFSIIRHLSYLTVDIPFSGQRWAPNIPDLVSHYLREYPKGFSRIVDGLSELLSPIEKQIYDQLYHCDEAREQTARFADAVERRLGAITNPPATIATWMRSGLTRDLHLAKKEPEKNRCAVIKLRSHFSNHPRKPVEIEASLRKARFSHATVYEYRAWNSDTLLEPDELIIDALISDKVTTNHIGKFLSWYISEFDDTDSDPRNFFAVMRKAELESGYSQILSKAVEIAYPGITVELEPWPLMEFGCFKEVDIRPGKGAIWAADACLDSPIVKHLIRDRLKGIPRSFKDQYAEVMGVRLLRATLRKQWRHSAPRCKWLIASSSVRFLKDGKEIMEYDGGLLRVSSRSGKLIWYGLETKNGAENPATSLAKRLAAIGVNAIPKTLNSSHAYVEVPLG